MSRSTSACLHGVSYPRGTDSRCSSENLTDFGDFVLLHYSQLVEVGHFACLLLKLRFELRTVGER